MKKLVFICGVIAVGLTLFAFRTSAVQPTAGEIEGIKTIVMQASWKPGFSFQAPSGPQWTLVQLGEIQVQAGQGEIVSAAGQACLVCHEDTYAELSKLTVNYVDNWGEKVNPHMYVDNTRGMSHANNAHNGRLIVPECIRCHTTAHSMPAPTAAQRTVRKGGQVTIRLNYCYSCHHDQSWEACSSCSEHS